MKHYPEPGPADPRDEAEFFLRVALEGTQPPPAEIVAQIMTDKIQVSDQAMNRLIEKGWIKRQRCEVWSRVMGYLRPVSHWNAGKKSEFRDSVHLDPHKIIPPPDT